MILFVAADHAQPDRKCPGSRACIRVVSQSKLDVQVQDVADAIDIDGELPPWFDGTPILLDEVSGAVYKGSKALHVLESAADDSPAAGDARRRPTAAPDPLPAPAPMRTPPAEDDAGWPQGQLPDGLKGCAESDDAFAPISDVGDGDGRSARDDKVTEQELQAFISARNASVSNAAVIT